MTVTLVCMAPSGETFITRNERGLLWLHQPVGAGGAGPVSEATARIAVVEHGFDRVEREFESWDALDEYRLERAAQVTPPIVVDRDAFDVDDVRELLGVAERWAAGGDDVGARELVFELLKVPVVREDDATYEQLLGFLGRLVRPRPIDVPLPSDPRKRRAREAWKQAA